MQKRHRLTAGLLLLLLLFAVGFLAFGWFATWSWGVDDVLKGSGLTVAQLEQRKPEDPQWIAQSKAWWPLPFVVVVEWSRGAKSLHGHGERTTFIWFFSLKFKIHRKVIWIA